MARSAERVKAKREAWRATLASIAAEDGFFEELGARHKAIFIPQDGAKGRTLVVVFDNLDDVRQDPDRLPWAVDFIAAQGWSALGFMAHGPTWYRDAAVHDFFDDLRDDDFFDGFDKVVFYGTSMGGYAAAAFSAAAPGATIVAINPQATLDRTIAVWERRYRPAWRYDYTDRYGYAPDMVRNAHRMWLFYDSRITADAMHAALFRGDHVSKIACPFMGHGMLSLWREMGVLKAVVSGCIENTITVPQIRRLMRSRRTVPRFQKAILGHLLENKRHELIIRYADAVTARRGAPHFANAARDARAALGRPAKTA
ncbi:MAG: alpha/beta fold hydrolase [Pseudomonadota bacterium]